MDQNQIFKPVVYRDIVPGMYSVSQYGNVVNNYTGQYLIPWISGSNYLYIGLRTIHNTDMKVRLHVLVATMFIPKTEEDIMMGRDEVNHKDRNKLNPYASNLEWMNREENLNYNIMVEMPRYPIIPIKQSPIRLNEEMVIDICELLQRGVPYKQIANIVGLDSDSDNDIRLIRYIKNKKKWKNIACNYEFPEYVSASNRVTEQQVIKICELLDAGNLTYPQISSIVGLDGTSKNNSSMITDIATGKSWTHISQNYNFINKERRAGNYRLNEQQVIRICELLEQGNLIYKDIAKMVGLEGNVNDVNLISKIAAGEKWTKISCNYNISKRRNNQHSVN